MGNMRLLVAVAVTAALGVLAACGSDSESSDGPVAGAPSSAPASSAPASSAPAAVPSKPAASSAKPAPKKASAASVRSVADDVQEYAVALEQFFFDNGYPQDLAGALASAKKLTNLSLSAGNKIATYTFDPDASEFQLCVENPSGASATYDTEPMSTIQTTNTGGCP